MTKQRGAAHAPPAPKSCSLASRISIGDTPSVSTQMRLPSVAGAIETVPGAGHPEFVWTRSSILSAESVVAIDSLRTCVRKVSADEIAKLVHQRGKRNPLVRWRGDADFCTNRLQSFIDATVIETRGVKEHELPNARQLAEVCENAACIAAVIVKGRARILRELGAAFLYGPRTEFFLGADYKARSSSSRAKGLPGILVEKRGAIRAPAGYRDADGFGDLAREDRPRDPRCTALAAGGRVRRRRTLSADQVRNRARAAACGWNRDAIAGHQ